MQLDIYPGPDCAGEIYDDDGHSMGFTHGAYLRQRVTCEAGPKGVTRFTLAKREGSYAPWWHQIAVTIPGGGNYGASLGGKALAGNGEGNSFLLDDQPSGAAIELTRP